MDAQEREQLVKAIALREGTAKEIASWFGLSASQLKKFVNANIAELEAYRDNEEELEREATKYDTSEPTPTELNELWITNKFQRLRRLQELAELAYKDAMHGNLAGADLATALREFRSYLSLAANELGQLLHRGSGDSGSDEILSVDIQGVDMESLR